MTLEKECASCATVKPVDQFQTTRISGKHYLRSKCAFCTREYDASLRAKRTSEHANRRAQLSRTYRADLSKADRFIYADSRQSDERAGRENNLTREFIRQCISSGCSYCGETALRITLDRKDNSIGHLTSNVVPACARCNFTRGNMPYEAWVLVAPGMRAAREAGTFGTWAGPRVGAKRKALIAG